jgi:hypothetical protein
VERGENIDKAKQLQFELLIAHRECHQSLIKSGLAEKRLGVFIDQLEDAPAALLDFALERRHLAKLVRPHALSKDGTRRLHRGSKKNLHPDTLSLRPVSEMKMKLLQAIFEEQVEEICLADSGGPGLGSVRQSLFVLEPIS